MSENKFSQKCDVCGVQPAMLFFRTIDNESSKIIEEGLCPKCALKKFSDNSGTQLAGENKEILNTINQMRHILSDIVGHIGKSTQEDYIEENDNTNIKQNINYCRACGTTKMIIKKEQKAGCGLCYYEFSDIIQNQIQYSNFSIKHSGQIPTRYRQQHLKNIELQKLKTKLFALLRTENYEEAAKINKRITKLESSQIHY